MRDTDEFVSKPHPDIERAYRDDCEEYRPERVVPLAVLTIFLCALSTFVLLLL